jgi:hypothetical protein
MNNTFTAEQLSKQEKETLRVVYDAYLRWAAG